jgi:hypothetical protein
MDEYLPTDHPGIMVARWWHEMSMEDRHMFVLRSLARGMSEPMSEDDVAAAAWAVEELQRLRPDLVKKGYKS